MYDAFLPLILVMAAIYAWQATLRARERARLLAQQICAQANVQLLDQTVSLQRLTLARAEDGRLHWRRRFRFEISTHGADRHLGTLDVMQDRLLNYSLPMSNSVAVSPPDSVESESNVVSFAERRGRTLH